MKGIPQFGDLFAQVLKVDRHSLPAALSPIPAVGPRKPLAACFYEPTRGRARWIFRAVMVLMEGC
jgi:hypothetical protein